MKKRVLAGAVATALAGPAYADPPPNLDLPTVFCFRVTDIERVVDSQGTVVDDSSFYVTFEVLNWTNRPATGVKLDLASDTGGGTSPGVSIGDAFIDVNGRGGTTGTSAADPAYGEIGGGGPGTASSMDTKNINPADAMPFHDGRGTINHPNDWRTLSQSSTSAFWDAERRVPVRR